ncbi:MAG: c-type cytochrome [Flavobacteriaceae bacterium]|nr:c-type cytochrome [Flavobacteriaceae bacterium]
MRIFFLSVIFLFLLAGCKPEKDDYIALYEEGEELLTGPLGVNSTSSNAFGFEIPGLSFREKAKFATGNSLFNQSWVSSPASTTARDGLGPTFNARACAGCHFKDGRGKPLKNGKLSSGFLMRISKNGVDEHGGPVAYPNYGKQIQDRGNRGIPFEARIIATYDTIRGAYPDGNQFELIKPIYSFSEEQFGPLGTDVLMSPRIGQQTIGLGLISALPDDQILQYEDEFDKNGDGISGRPNYVWNPELNKMDLGKYGWKANAPSLKVQIADAFNGDMGLTTTIFNENNCPDLQKECVESPNGGEPEVTDTQLDKVLFYQTSLAVPNRRNFKTESVLRGKMLFNALNCKGCHAINQKTGGFPFNKYLENITIKPYSDFLLHDMGDDLADNRPDFMATGREWRTQPLWGIGLISTVNEHTNFLHDGRARSIEEAILWHGGEAEKSKQEFMKLSVKERKQLIDFVNSL